MSEKNATLFCAPEVPIQGVTYLSPERGSRYLEADALTCETLGMAFRKVAAERADDVALIWLGGQMTYRELDEASDRLGAGLLACGLQTLDRIVVQMRNSPEQLALFIACWKAGLIPVCTLSAHREHEISYLAQHAGAKAHVVDIDDPKFDFLDFANRMQAQVNSLEIVLGNGASPAGNVRLIGDLARCGSLSAARARLQQVHQDPFQVAAFQLSGGTTGVPKIIPRIHSEYLYNMREVMRFKRWTPDDCVYVPMPFAHNLAMGCCWGPFLMSGGRVAITPHPALDLLVRALEDLKPTIVGAARPIILRLKEHLRQAPVDLSCVREIFSTDAARIVTEQLGVPGHHIFGMTEGVIMFTADDDPDDAIYGTVGRPVSAFDEVRLLVPGTEKDAAPGEIGELATRGAYTIRGYFNAPERNAEAFTTDEFYKSGDLMKAVEINGETYYSFEGRTKDVVDRANEKINAEEVERACLTHAAFADVAVVAMPDPVFGEKVCLYATLSEGAVAPDVTTLGQHLKVIGLAKFKWPERIEIIDALPLTKVGKLDKAFLRQAIAAKVRIESGAAHTDETMRKTGECE